MGRARKPKPYQPVRARTLAEMRRVWPPRKTKPPAWMLAGYKGKDTGYRRCNRWCETWFWSMGPGNRTCPACWAKGGLPPISRSALMANEAARAVRAIDAGASARWRRQEHAGCQDEM